MSKEEFPLKRKYVGRPYSQVNCWDLAREFYFAEFNVELKRYHDGPTPDRKESKALIYANIGDFEKVEKPEFGDLIMIMIHGIESHIGIYIGKERVLHSLVKIGSVVEPLEKFKKCIVGYYRLKGLKRD